MAGNTDRSTNADCGAPKEERNTARSKYHLAVVHAIPPEKHHPSLAKYPRSGLEDFNTSREWIEASNQKALRLSKSGLRSTSAPSLKSAAAGDIDYYVDMRAALRSWREAMDDPKKRSADPRFNLRQWVMLDEERTLGLGMAAASSSTPTPAGFSTRSFLASLTTTSSPAAAASSSWRQGRLHTGCAS
jgi:hypothetical protein